MSHCLLSLVWVIFRQKKPHGQIKVHCKSIFGMDVKNLGLNCTWRHQFNNQDISQSEWAVVQYCTFSVISMGRRAGIVRFWLIQWSYIPEQSRCFITLMQRSCESSITRQQSSSLICKLILCGNQKGQISLGRNTFLCQYIVILPKPKGEYIKQTHTEAQRY